MARSELHDSKVSKTTLLKYLNGYVSADERAALENDSGLYISQYNRATIIRMLDMEKTIADPEKTEDAVIDIGQVRYLKDALRNYLDVYMADRPDGHKWIVLSCLFSTFIAGEPMHPQEVAHWEKIGDSYCCPARDASEDSLCLWCACQKKL